MLELIGRFIVATTFADRKRIVSPFGSRQRGGTRKPHEISRKHVVRDYAAICELDPQFPTFANGHSLTNQLTHQPTNYSRVLPDVPRSLMCGIFVSFRVAEGLSCPDGSPSPEGVFRGGLLGRRSPQWVVS